MIILASLIVAAAIAWAALHIVAELRAGREETARARTAALLALFAPGVADAQRDPRGFLVWQPIAAIARQLFPSEAAALDRAAGGRFPFTVEQIQSAHAQWTADWLAWERAHDAIYKRKASVASAWHQPPSVPAVIPPRSAASSNQLSRRSSICISGDTRSTSGSAKRCNPSLPKLHN